MIVLFRRVAVVAGMVALASSARGQAPALGDTVTVTRRVLVSGDMTPVEAKRQALEQALADAVRRVAGVRVQSAQLGVNEDRNARIRDSFLSVVQLDAAGRATDYRILDEKFTTVGSQLYVELRALVTVAAERGAADPGFTVSVTLNDALFFDKGTSLEGNDEVIATVITSKTAWLTVFGVTGDSAQLLLPNAYMTDHRVTAGVAAEVPSRDWRDRGIHFRASLPATEKARRELIVVVATQAPVTFPPPGDADAAGVFPLLAMQRWLVTIPLDQRAMAFAPYEVRRKQP